MTATILWQEARLAQGYSASAMDKFHANLTLALNFGKKYRTPAPFRFSIHVPLYFSN